jgi:hypothetical protein
MVCREVLAMLNLCRILSVPWSQYELRLNLQKKNVGITFGFCEIWQMQRPYGPLLTLRINTLGVRFFNGASLIWWVCTYSIASSNCKKHRDGKYVCAAIVGGGVCSCKGCSGGSVMIQHPSAGVKKKEVVACLINSSHYLSLGQLEHSSVFPPNFLVPSRVLYHSPKTGSAMK